LHGCEAERIFIAEKETAMNRSKWFVVFGSTFLGICLPAAADDAVAQKALAAYEARFAVRPEATPESRQVPSVGAEWLAQGVELAQAAQRPLNPPANAPTSSPSTGPALTAPTSMPAGATGRAYVPWKERRGPAYPGDFWTSMGRDAKEIPEVLWDDTKAVFTNPVALIGIALARASGIAINASGADDRIADQTRNHRQLDTFWDSTFDAGGSPAAHFAVAGALYLVTLANVDHDTKAYETSKTLLSALVINGVTTEALKVATRTRSPNGDPLGWPSGHTSSSFAFATVMAESYGPWAGVPLYGFAAMVGYERIDARNHDFSDVVSGAILGAAIGYAVSENHKARINGWEVVPLVTSDSVGVGLAKSW
jgi:membrane-associated phospholipid phosphatase